MKPVAIFRHSPTEGPGYFAIFLERQGIPWRLIAIDQGESVPATVDGFSGLCFMGGPMSVNDPLPWIEPVCKLIRAAVALNIFFNGAQGDASGAIEAAKVADAH